MALSCGEGGSTGAEVITQINENTEAIAGFTPYYDKDTQVDHLGLPDTYTVLAEMSNSILPAGEYVIFMTGTYVYDTPNKTMFLRFTVNGGTPEEFEKEPQSGTGREAYDYAFPYTHAADGPFSLTTEMRKEDGTGTLDVLFANVWMDGKVATP